MTILSGLQRAPAIGTAVRIRCADGGYLATVTGRARLTVVVDGRTLDRTLVWLDSVEGHFSAPLHEDDDGCYCQERELVAEPTSPRRVARRRA